MKSVRLDSDTPANDSPAPPIEDEEIDVLDTTGKVPLSCDSPPKPSDAHDENSEVDVIDTSNEDAMVTIEVHDNPNDPAKPQGSGLPALHVDAVGAITNRCGPEQMKIMRRPKRRTQNALITISTLANDGPIQDSINTFPLEIQVAFRVKVLGIFSLHLLVLSLLVIIFTYSPLTTTSLERFADDDTSVALGGTLILGLGALFALFLVKFYFPFNLVMLVVFTCIQAVCITLMGLFFETKASVLMCLLCFFIMAIMTFFSTRRRVNRDGDVELCPSLAACFFSYIFVTIVACIIFAAKGTGIMSGTTFGLAMLFTFPIVMWFAFDAHCMYQIMTPDEYLSGVIFFYTDLALFLIFIVVMIASIAMCDGGVPMACFGGSCGVNIDPSSDFVAPVPASADTPSSPDVVDA